ncbi:hypothetical protein PMY12_14860 [Clostridium tertium]|uniref:hypothetical protein n=2 Tax=Bacteria TaxID=2 RepID=UPI00232C9856|nr:hypothetical protein [Clostridium tertium]MDB1931669.1 hypothetical protein [Clostridium tertium]MDB1938285.1 hypothetical protein [Clostridium tertium]MDI9216038.1 hypothetical protein [Clostridium tertium]
MFVNKVLNKTSKNLNVVKIDGTDLENLGLYLEKDYEITYTQSEEFKVEYIRGREMPYHKKIRSLPIEFKIQFNLKESSDFYSRIDYIRRFLESKKEKEAVITFNKENKGFKIYWVTVGEIVRKAGRSTINITFQCYPNIVSVEI